jgi:hypothetical protein
MAVPVPDFERIVSDRAFLENTFVALTCFLRLRKVIGKISPYELLPRVSGDSFRGFVDVGDPAVRRDSNKRVQARLDQATVISTGT